MAALGAGLLGAASAASASRPSWLPLWPLWTLTGAAAALALHERLGRPVPFLRWSFIRMLLGTRALLRNWQVGDGREEAAARYVVENAPPGDVDAAIRAIDEYAYRRQYLINVGDEKSAFLEAAIRRVRPRRALELGAYVGYSALRTARLLPPGGHLYSVELNPANADIARRLAAHAGVADRVTFLTGHLGDGGETIALLAEQAALKPGRVDFDFVFLDHAKDAYLPDLERILAAGWLHAGSVVLADNMRFPGSPPYLAYMKAEEGKRWRTIAHRAHVEYQSLIPDTMLESTLLTEGWG